MAQTQSETRQVAADQAGKGAARSPTDPKSDPTDPKNPKNGASTASDADPTELLKSDHRHVEQLFGSFEKATNAGQKSQLAEQICTALMVHTLIEEEIFYPACKGHVEQRPLEEAQVEHDGAKTLITEINAGSPSDQYFDAKVKVLSEEIKHHVREEEKSDGILAKAKEAGVATPDLAKQMAARRQELMEQAKAGNLGPPVTRSFRVRTNAGTNQPSQEHNMVRGSSSAMERERDERGRFISDDDDRDYRRRSSSRRYDDDDDRRRSMPARDDEGRFTSSRSRYEYDDDRRRSMARDDEGRFTSSRSRYDDDDDPRSSRSRSRYDDEDDDRRDRGGLGGWFGDPRSHSEAARRGWEERGGSRSNYRDEDDDRGRHMPARDDEGRFTSSRSRYDNDDDRRSSRSRYGAEDDDRRGGRGHGGWYGDPEGHSEASRRGWEEREGSRTRYRDEDDDRRRHMPARDDEGRFTSSRSRYDDDEGDRRGSGRHGGWYGDPEGHSQAARRGRR